MIDLLVLIRFPGATVNKEHATEVTANNVTEKENKTSLLASINQKVECYMRLVC